ncbi:hypothetical protein [uncultured Parabacteroides sp.]|uniref:hypothetical protein n=1 Tax=uncultured Parabacteroides sp. TaxID=512312 RepID=UPI0025E990F8|nr:hypothetical protein [uncultured Parabacteroides sp.]
MKWIFCFFSVLFLGCLEDKLNEYEVQEECFVSEYLSEIKYLQSVFYEEDLSAPRFFLFGMGRNDKFIYKNGYLYDLNGAILYSWNIQNEEIRPSEYEVCLYLEGGKDSLLLKEDQLGIWMIQDSVKSRIGGDSADQEIINLPDFKGFRYPEVLKVLLHEVLFNVKNGMPYPNVLVYHTPWYRDAFIIAMCLRATNNEKLILPWIKSLENVYDCNVKEKEADNLGQLLYLISLCPKDERNNDLIQKVLHEASGISVKDTIEIPDQYIQGYTDGAILPVYQTLLLKFGMANLAIKDEYHISLSADYYTDLLWMYKKKDVSFFKYVIKSIYKRSIKRDFSYPYLDWAKAHYHHSVFAPVSAQAYPLSWEYGGNNADLEKMLVIDKDAVSKNVLYPHAWHAAEMFLYLLEFKDIE